MLQRRVSGNVVIYISPLLEGLGVRHAFSTRLGGVSPAPFDSLNLGNPNGCALQDAPERVAANYDLVLSAAGCPIPGGRGVPLRVHQVHGNQVAVVSRQQPFDAAQCADAVVSRDPRRAISVRAADCVPILLSSGDGRTVCAIHAGWRGIVAGVIENAIQRMRGELSSGGIGDFVAAIGPCIGRQAFEVGPEVLEEFSRIFGSKAPVEKLPGGKGRVDLRETAKLQLIGSGVSANRIDITDRCTFEHREEFFSHRREHGVTGRMAALVVAAP
jgi:polyphenol oxidase